MANSTCKKYAPEFKKLTNWKSMSVTGLLQLMGTQIFSSPTLSAMPSFLSKKKSIKRSF